MEFKKEFEEIFLSQIVSIGGGLFAGTILAIYVDRIFLIPGILLIFPAFLDLRGNISGSLASRLSSGLFLGIVKPKISNTKIIRGNLVASLLLAILISFFLGVIAFLFNYVIIGKFIPVLIVVPVVAGVIANIIEVPITLFMTFYIFKKGHDPNNIMGPFVTSTGDIISILSLLFTLVIL
ncbi:MAG: magnesium transporter [Candidatus Woesearchaeota archaeon]